MNLTEGPFIDIIMPNYNKAEFISEAVDSVVKQSYKNWYLYIMDGGSTDLSLQKLSKFSKIKNIRIISFKRNKGPGFSRNYGMRISNSKYISFLDSDDEWHKEKLAIQMEIIMEKSLDYLGARFQYQSFEYNKKNKKQLGMYSLNKLLMKNVIATSGVIIRKKFFQELKGFDCNLKYAEDYDLWMRASLKKNLCVIKCPSLVKRKRSIHFICKFCARIV